MELVKTVEDLQSFLTTCRTEGQKIGFVPTMGALHEGHLSLIRASKQKTDATVCSIFVNPTQFNDREDYEKYPQTLEQDLALLESENCDFVFVPSYNEVYGTEMSDKFSFGNLETVMEGAFRPGHFSGVATVVAKLLNIVQPDLIVFGDKDLGFH